MTSVVLHWKSKRKKKKKRKKRKDYIGWNGLMFKLSLYSMHASPFLLLRADWRSPTFSLNCDITSLVAPQISKSLTDRISNNSSTHVSIRCWERAWQVAYEPSSPSKDFCSSSSPDRPVHTDCLRHWPRWCLPWSELVKLLLDFESGGMRSGRQSNWSNMVHVSHYFCFCTESSKLRW